MKLFEPWKAKNHLWPVPFRGEADMIREQITHSAIGRQTFRPRVGMFSSTVQYSHHETSEENDYLT
jgi:hypothetical protein